MTKYLLRSARKEIPGWRGEALSGCIPGNPEMTESHGIQRGRSAFKTSGFFSRLMEYPFSWTLETVDLKIRRVMGIELFMTPLNFRIHVCMSFMNLHVRVHVYRFEL